MINFTIFSLISDFLYLALEKCECSLSDILDFVNDNNKKTKKTKERSQRNEFIFSFLKKKSLSSVIIKNIMIQCTKGLNYLHSNSIVHR